MNGQVQVIGTGHYEDVLRKVNGQWKFAKRKIVRDVPPDEPIRGIALAKARNEILGVIASLDLRLTKEREDSTVPGLEES